MKKEEEKKEQLTVNGRGAYFLDSMARGPPSRFGIVTAKIVARTFIRVTYPDNRVTSPRQITSLLICSEDDGWNVRRGRQHTRDVTGQGPGPMA